MNWTDIGVSVLVSILVTLGRIEVEWFITRHKKNREYLLQLGIYHELQMIAGTVRLIHNEVKKG